MPKTHHGLVNRITYHVPKRLKTFFLTKEINRTTWEGEKKNVGKRQMEYGTEMRCLPPARHCNIRLGKLTSSLEATLPKVSREKDGVYAQKNV